MEIFKLFGSILVDSADAENSISKTGSKAEGVASKLGSGIKTAAKWGAALAAGAAVAGGAIMGVATSAAAATDDIDKMSQKIGISREAYQELSFACSQSGTDVTVLKNGVKTLTNQMQMASEGNKTAAAAFDALGISIYDVNGNLKSQEDMMFESMAALQNMDDQTQKAALAVDLFGKAGSELMPMLNGASGSIDNMRQQAHDLGLVISDDAVDAGVQFTDTMDQLKRSFGAVATNVGVELMPVIMDLANWVIEHMPEIQEVAGRVFDAIGEAIDYVKPLITALSDAFSALVEGIQTDGTTLNDIWETIKTVFDAALTFITDLLDVFSALFSGDWDELWDSIKKLIDDIWESVKSIVSDALDAVIGIFKGIWEKVKSAAVDVFNKAKEGFKEAWDDITEWFSGIVGSVVDTVTGIGTDLFNAGKSIFTSLWDGIKDVWDGVKKWVSDKVNWIADKLMFWRKSSDEMDTSKVDGSHAAGLPFVPYDGYVAELHRGEAVLNANDTSTLIQKIGEIANATNGSGGEYTINLSVELDGEVVARKQINHNRREERLRGKSFVNRG